MSSPPMLIVAACLAGLAAPASAAAAPPPNDNYLASTTIQAESGAFPLGYADRVDTTEATTQADTFNPNRDGVPFEGGDPEPTACPNGGAPYGKTAWWDFRPPFSGGVEVQASGNFDVVVAVYKWSAQTSKLTRTVRCQNDSRGGETVLLPNVDPDANYTIQVGGADGAGGLVDLTFRYFPDRDNDGVLDANDKCDTRRGVRGSGGCPPELRSAPRIRYDRVAGGIRVTGLAVDDVPKGARAEVRCKGCGRKVSKRAPRSGVLLLNGFVGRTVRTGRRIEVRVTLGPTGRGKYRFGATGKYVSWPVNPDGLGDRRTRCLNPGSTTPVKCR